jgi:molybdate transport system substrate-binding protein
MLSFALRALALSLALGVTSISENARAQAPGPPIAAAADLKFALTEVANRYQSETGTEVKVSFGSSGNFATQIEQGAPFQLFFSADESLVQKLASKQLTKDGGVAYAVGRIVLFTPAGSTVTADDQLLDLKAALADGRLKRFAIANPEHAPYGQRAMEALKHAGIWDAIQPRLVLGENIAQAAQFATAGGSQGGIIALSLVKAPEVAKLGSYALIPDSWHQPLVQRMVLMKNASAGAEAFYRYVQSPTARGILRRYGFVLPGEQ